VMNTNPRLVQTPAPGEHLCCVQGDTLEIALKADPPNPGTAWLRTNLGHAAHARAELITHVEAGTPILGRDWFDIPMQREKDGQHTITLGLAEVGHFQAKCFLLPDNASEPLWPDGENLVINVECADTCCGNTLYNAFVRLFGANEDSVSEAEKSHVQAIEALDQAGYTIIPPSGTFRGLIAALDFIIGTLGCRIIQLLPIHPTPTTYARMGRFGSPYAALSFTAVDPALAEFDPKHTPLDQFQELVDEIHARNAKVFLDIAINHTGWAAALHATHPQWLARNSEGEIDVPGAWGVTWADLTRLDYRHKELWQYMADVFITWCRRGADGFRCDAGYMIPVPTWEYIIARVRNQFPETIFLLEGLGGKISVTRDLLNRANFNWAYSELFQNYDRLQVETYLNGAMQISQHDGLTVHFAETHDNDRLAATSTAYARMRTSLCALLSFQGAFGFANGVEWFATEKINVHEATSLNWGAGDNQVAHISRLNAVLKTHPCFFHGSRLRFIATREGSVVALVRSHPPTGKTLLILVNLDHSHSTRASWPARDLQPAAVYCDLLTDREIRPDRSGSNSILQLAPGEALCLTADKADVKRVAGSGTLHLTIPDQVVQQRLRAKVMNVHQALRGTVDMRMVDLDKETACLVDDPVGFCRALNQHSDESRTITWNWPHDVRREVMVPPGHFLVVRSSQPFHCRLMRPDNTVMHAENCFQDSQGRYFALALPAETPAEHCRHHLYLTIFGRERCERAEAAVLYLSAAEHARVKTVFEMHADGDWTRRMLGTNGRGGMMRSHFDWRRLNSRYDGLLAANLNPLQPEDRWMMLARFRGWVVYQGYSQEIGPETLKRFSFDFSSAGCWVHDIPTGHGRYMRISLGLQMAAGKNTVQLAVLRHPANDDEDRLADDKPVTLILRPDIDDRNFHDTTKAYTGPETQWKSSVSPVDDGFVFQPHPDRRLYMRMPGARFVNEPEWQYMVHRGLEAQRGLDPDSDLFSPGYFTVPVRGGDICRLDAGVPYRGEKAPLADGALEALDADLFPGRMRTPLTIPKAMAEALGQYLVRRGELKTVIAGYPWFLDWGRDTLIVARALVAVGKLDAAKAIVRQFAGFEKHGTIPNMLSGSDSGNRDTSDAPLWLFTVCSDLADMENSYSLFEMDCGGRSLRIILVSMAHALMNGTPNNIKMDPESGLLFSPSHFTWMDTNHPACTPRQGYPVEIQALWHAALNLLAHIDRGGDPAAWQNLADRVRTSIQDLFFLPKKGYLSDCLHAAPGIPASGAKADDALRPNQLLAITLGAFTETESAERMLAACEALLVPGAIRSLADQPVKPPLAIVHHGQALNTPEKPYWGRYEGDEDTRRKPAYHNGTAWTWLFPSYSEAWFRVYGEASKETALAWLASSAHLINSGCVGHVPEILEGDAPHRQRGCDAQAWGASELLRVWSIVDR
jgi:starch synthase (maltosyl-transferring)